MSPCTGLLKLGKKMTLASLVWDCLSPGLPAGSVLGAVLLWLCPWLLLTDPVVKGDIHGPTHPNPRSGPASHCCPERPSHICTTKRDRAWHRALSLDQSGRLITSTFWHGFWPVPTSPVPGIAWALFKDQHLFPRGNTVEVTPSGTGGGRRSV